MKKETWKLISQVQRDVSKFAKQYVKKEGFRGISNVVYKKIEDLLVSIVFFVRKDKGHFKLSVRIKVKAYNYDDLFWKIFQMESNILERESLRANGAFTCPSIELAEKEYEITVENYEEVIILVVEEFYQILHVFLEDLKKNYIDFNDYVLKQEGILDEKLLKMLANISIHRILDAKQMAVKEVEEGDTGKFENEDLGIYEHIIIYCDNLLKEK